MKPSWVYMLPLWIEAILAAIVLFVALELGFRIGLGRHRSRQDRDDAGSADVTLGAMLALLGLMLAFTYAFSLGRADLRKAAIINEANAIGTAFLRADLADEPGRSELRMRLLEYARTRLITADQVSNRSDLRQGIARSLDAQSELWPATKKALEGNIPGPLQASIVQAVNDVLDAHAKRLAAAYDRIPGIVLILLVLVAAASLAWAGQSAGLRGNLQRWRMSAFALVLAALIMVIIDFDRPLSGLIQASNESLTTLIEDMQSSLELDSQLDN